MCAKEFTEYLINKKPVFLLYVVQLTHANDSQCSVARRRIDRHLSLGFAFQICTDVFFRLVDYLASPYCLQGNETLHLYL